MSFRLVSQVISRGQQHNLVQQFRYHGAVSHVGGLGFLGFQGLARTNTYGNGTVALWSHTFHNPQKRGTLTHSWTSRSFNQNFTIPTTPFNGQGYSYVQKAEYQYQTFLSDQNVFVNNIDNALSKDGLTGFETLQTYNYDDYYNPTSILTERQGGSTRQSFVYQNNATATDEKYHIGRVEQETTTETWNNKTHTTTAQYTYDNNLVKQTRTQGDGTEWLTEDFSYDRFGNLLSKKLSAPGLVSRDQSYTYTTDGRFLESSTGIEGLTMRFAYNGDGTLKTETDPFDKTTTYSYDGWQRPQTVTDYLGNTATTEYLWSGDHIVKHNTGADGSQSKAYIDVWNRVTHKGSLALKGQWRWVSTTHTADGKVATQTEPYVTARNEVTTQSLPVNTPRTQNYYDAVGRLSSQKLPSGKTISTTYERNSPTTTVNDGYQEITTVLDSRGNIARMTDPNGTIVYTYHPTGELEESNYEGHTVRVTYDGWGRKTALYDDSTDDYFYKYDLYGQLLEESSRKGTTTYQYDAAGKLKEKTQKGDETHLVSRYDYDSQTQLLEEEKTNDRLSGDTQVYAYTYDAYQRPYEVTETNDYASFSQTLGYDRLGRLSSENRTVAGGGTRQSVNLTHGYAPNGQLTTLKDGNKTLWTLEQDNARGQATHIQLGNGISKSRSYDPLGYLERITDGNALSMAYTYNKKQGTMASRHHGGYDKEFFSHDNRSRLTRVVQGGRQTFKQEYDPIGRITDNAKVGAYNYFPPEETPNRYALQGFTLNAAGYKYYKKHWKRELTFNMDRKPVSIHQHGLGKVDFAYGSSMQRLHSWYTYDIPPENKEDEAEVESYHRKHYATIFPAEITVNETTGATVITQYLGGDAYTAPVIKQNSQYRYLHRDHLGSILAITDDTGKVLEQRHFDAWGTITSFKKNGQETEFKHSILKRGFTGHEHFEQVSLIHMNGRMYNPRLHRFLGPDNFIQDPYNTMSYDRQAYVWNNPLMSADPSGEFLLTVMSIVKVVSFIMTGISTAKAIINGQSFGSILMGIGVGILLGQISAGLAGDIGKALFSSAAETLAGHFIRGFVPVFAGSFLVGTGSALMGGANIGEALKTGVISGAIAGTMAGLKNVHGAKVQAQKLASAKAAFDLQKRAEAAFGGGAEVPSITSEGLAENVKLKWGADIDLTLAELKPRNTTPWMDIAKGELGQTEISGSKHNQRILQYHSKTSLNAKRDERPWCSSFTNWVMDQTGIEGTNDALAKSWLNWEHSKLSDKYEYGSLAVVRNKASGQYHVGFATKATATYVQILGGNQGPIGSGSVRYSNYYFSAFRLVSYVKPFY